MRIRRATTALAVIAGFITSSAIAWEHSGFSSGMTLAQANAAALNQHNGILQPLKGWQSTFRFGSPGGTLSFCGDTLFGLNINVAGGLEAYASIAEELVDRYGQPRFLSEHQFGDGGVLAHVRTSWVDELNDEVGLTLTTYAGGPLTAARAFSSHARLCIQ